MPMILLSVNVSLPVEIRHGNQPVRTGIFKKPAAGPVRVGAGNLEGDGQADRKNHGGEDKAVYAYSFDHYAYWREILDTEALPYGQFGENLTISGLDENESCIGDRLSVGGALLTITQPRVPCFKLGIRLGDTKVPRLFSESCRTGFYLRVLREGVIEAGDEVKVLERGHAGISVKALFGAWLKPAGTDAARILRRALEVPELAAAWRGQIEKKLGGDR